MQLKWLPWIALVSAVSPAAAEPFGANLDDVVSSEFSEATSDREKNDEDVSIRRGSLDTSVVVELVHDRLREAGVEAAARVIRKLMNSDVRPWMRDLYTAVIDIATNREQSVKIAGEAILRIGGRALLADAIVRVRLPDAADAEVVSDWLYWRLSRLSFLSGSAARPPCVEGPGKATCDAFAALADDVAIARIDTLTGIDKVLKAIKVASRLRDSLAGKNFSLRELLGEIVAVDPDLTAELLGLDVAKVNAALAVIKQGRAAYEAITMRWTALKNALKGVQNAVTTCFVDASCAPGKPAFDKVVIALGDLQLVLASDVLPGKRLADAIASLQASFPGLARNLGPIVTAVDAYRTLVPAKLDRAALEALLMKHAPRDLLELVNGQKLPALIEQAELLATALGELTTLLGTAKLGELDLKAAKAINAAAAAVAGQLALVAEAVVALELTGVNADELESIAAGARKLVGWCRLLDSIATGIVDGKLGDVLDVLRSLGGGEVAPILDLLEPVLDDIFEAGRIEPRHLFAAFAQVSAQDLLTALHLPTDLATACKKEDGTCWAVRLVLMAHDAVSVEGTTIEIHTEKVVDSLSRITGSRRDQACAPYLHLAVGTGVLIAESDELGHAKPLIAEQVGVGMKVLGNEDVALRLAIYGSGLLYRFVLDSKESDGVMFGGAVMLDLFGDVEFYASTAVLIAPGAMETDESTVDWVGTLGVQVPLGAYIEKLAD